MPAPIPALVVTFEQARHIVERHASRLRPCGNEGLALLESVGRILAEPILADRDFPPFPRATRDGFAVCAADVATLPATLRVTGEVKAGAANSVLHVRPGEAVAIMTGAPVPPGAHAVVMIEYTSQTGDQVEIRKAILAGDNIVPEGAEARCGETLLAPGLRIDQAAVAVAASVGKSRIGVYQKPRVAILATGDELVDLEAPLASTQIRNSNSYSLGAQVHAAGGEPVLLPIAPDDANRLRELIAEGFAADLLLLTGGVSMGKYDLVEQVLAELHAEFFFTGAKIQPGRPVVFGRAQWGTNTSIRAANPPVAGLKYFFGLPGNPVSTMVTFELFVRPLLESLAGRIPHKLIFLHATLKAEIKTKVGLKRFLPAVLSGEFEQAEVELMAWHGSGDIAAMARANCYVVVPPDRELIEAGEWVPVLVR